MGIIVAVESQADGESGFSMLDSGFHRFLDGFGDTDEHAGKGDGVLVFTVGECFQLPAVFVDEGDGIAHFSGDLLLDVVE